MISRQNRYKHQNKQIHLYGREESNKITATNQYFPRNSFFSCNLCSNLNNFYFLNSFYWFCSNIFTYLGKKNTRIFEGFLKLPLRNPFQTPITDCCLVFFCRSNTSVFFTILVSFFQLNVGQSFSFFLFAHEQQLNFFYGITAGLWNRNEEEDECN